MEEAPPLYSDIGASETGECSFNSTVISYCA
jgi:hypothetical protein